MEQIRDDAVTQGLDGLVVFVINEASDADYADRMEDYSLPVLQDTEAADIFGAYGATSYDLFIIDREGYIGYAEQGAHPASQPGHVLTELARFQ